MECPGHRKIAFLKTREKARKDEAELPVIKRDRILQLRNSSNTKLLSDEEANLEIPAT
jgi:hypothetical protein